ncbi:hypothetical protein [Haloarchaeobius sp. FL176]|uniref:hypothetical protein n=1 Tax=Haloarchaeobius sp. FL176 TaxID=2967129 RepID=UPI0021478E80|nr:hypothetical protein [Haloarchaeobius sp. FL176]
MLSAGVFIAGLVLFVGGVSAIRTTPGETEPADTVLTGRRRRRHRDAPMDYVQVDGAVLGILGLLFMLGTTLL